MKYILLIALVTALSYSFNTTATDVYKTPQTIEDAVIRLHMNAARLTNK